MNVLKQIVSLVTLLAAGAIVGVILVAPVWKSGQFSGWWLAFTLALALLGAFVIVVSAMAMLSAARMNARPGVEARAGRGPVRDEAADKCVVCCGALAVMRCKTHDIALCGSCHGPHDRADCTYRFLESAGVPRLTPAAR